LNEDFVWGIEHIVLNPMFFEGGGTSYMEESEGIERVKNGVNAAFENWMDLHSDQIERFAIQFGCTRESAGKVTEETFRTFFTDLKNLDDEERLRYDLYRMVLEKLVHIQRTEPLRESSLSFEEDQQLHEKIINLEEKAKLSLILSQFHGMNEVEIATITGISADAVEESIVQAVKQLTVEIDSSLLERRLEFLHKSYGRISSSFRKNQVFAKPQKEIQATGKLKQKISKKAMVSWIAGILVLLLLVIVPAVTGEEYKKASAEKYVEQLKVSFAEEIASRHAVLGLSEPTEEDKQEFYYFGYGKQAREDFEMMIQREERVIAESGRIDKKSIGKQYDEIVKTLTLPSEMVEQLVKNPLISDKEKSEEFIIEYLKQINEIQQSYSAILFRHHQLIENVTVDGAINVEKYLEMKESYPEELQKALNSMEKQNLYLVPLYSGYAKTELSAQIKASIHKDFRGYITFLETSSINYYAKPVSSYVELIDTLVEMEKTLLANAQIEIPTITLEDYYSWLVYLMVVGTETNPLVGSNGKVTEEVKSIWMKVAANGEGSPSAFIMQKVINEMEASGWTESVTQSHLNLFHLGYAVGLAREGRLHTFEMSGILQSDRGLSSVTFPDSSFEDLVQKTYELYSTGHDSAVLKDAHPLVVFAVYCFANDHEDPETMWHLYNPEDDLHTLEEYISGWRKVDVNLYEMKSLLFDGRESSTGSIGFERGSMNYFDAEMVLDETAGWKIKHIDLNFMKYE